ncbi:MAG: radical SAM protein, partial [Thermodesulfobacteriota bacterium]
EGSVRVEAPGGIKTLDSPITDGLAPGDWVLHINSLIIRKISSEDAGEIIELLESGNSIDTSLLSARFKETIESAHTGNIKEAEIAYLLGVEGLEKEALLKEADTVRRAYLKDFLCIHGIIEFSNYCTFECGYCGLASGNQTLKRYRMSADEIVGTAIGAVNEKGYKLLVLQSGEDPHYTDNMLTDIIKRIKRACRVFIFISAGERGFDSYRTLKEAGASGVLFRFETSNEELFKRLHAGGKGFKSRFDHLSFLKELGFYIATGSLTGLPGQTLEDIAKDIIETKKFANMVSTGPFIPAPGTPLETSPAGDPELQLKVNAVLRLLMKKARLPVVTAFETLSGEGGRKRALSSGANSLMINLTPEKYRNLYTIYPDKFYDEDSVFVRYGLYKYKESYSMLEERMSEELGDKLL